MAVEAPPAPPAPTGDTGLNPPPPAGSAKESMFSGLNKIAREPDQKNTPAPTAKKTEAPKPDVKPPEKPQDKAPDAKPDAKPPEKSEDVKPPEAKPDVPPKNKKPSDFLREELTKTKTERDTLRAEIEKLKAPKEDPEKKTLSEKLAVEEKRRKEIEDELRFTNYERSPEFKEKYVKPYNDAWVDAMSDLEETVVPNADGTFRKATKDDLMKIINLPIQQAGQLAEELFGKAERTMMDHRSSILKTWKSQQHALSEGRKIAEQREQEFTTQQQKQQAELKKLQSELRTSKEADFIQRHPELVIAKDEKGEWSDPKAAELLERDRSVTDNLFKDESKMSPEKKLELHAEMRNRAAHYGLVLHNYRKALTELTELKQKLKEYEDSEPVPGDGDPKPPPELAGAVGMTSMIEGLNKIARERVGPPGGR